MKETQIINSQSGLTEFELKKTSELYETVKSVFGFDFVAGLPCGELGKFISEAREDKEINHLQTLNEREAVAASAGAWLAGKKPVLYMQNSGFFEASNDTGSLLIASKIPVLFVVSWRGCPGEEATQHLATGKATIPLLENFGLPYAVWPDIKAVAGVKGQMDAKMLPGVILVKRERFNKTDTPVSSDLRGHSVGTRFTEIGRSREINREECLQILFDKLISKDDAVVSSTGLISRSIYHNQDSANQIYNAGAFGLTGMIGLGFALNKKDKRTYMIEGDGSILTNLGSLNVIGSNNVNCMHIVLDNEAYFSCSGEPTYGSGRIPAIARMFGYKKIYTVYTKEGLVRAIDSLKGISAGPTMLHVKINKQGRRDFKRPLEMPEIARRFKKYFNENEK